MKLILRTYIIGGLISILFLIACGNQQNNALTGAKESEEAKNLLQGIWKDSETEEIIFRAKGDTLYYTDSENRPTYFRIISDSIEIGRYHYIIIKQSSNLFWFKNQNGDIVKLSKSNDPNDALFFVASQQSEITPVTEVIKKDSVVLYKGNQYHWYIAINPTHYRVTKSSYSDDGVGVDNIYYDNIVNISLYQSGNKIFSSDIKKQMYSKCVPSSFIEHAILSNVQFNCIDDKGVHFDATLCIPDGATCYLISTDISFEGELSMKLMEY